MYHDQLQVLYNHYQVVGVKVQLRLCAPANNASTELPILVGFAIRDDSTLPTDFRQEIENGRCVTTLVANTDKVHRLTAKWSARDFFGPERANDEAVGAAFGASPSDIAWGHFIIQSQNASAATPAIYADILIDFAVKVGEPKVLARS